MRIKEKRRTTKQKREITLPQYLRDASLQAFWRGYYAGYEEGVQSKGKVQSHKDIEARMNFHELAAKEEAASISIFVEGRLMVQCSGRTPREGSVVLRSFVKKALFQKGNS